MEREQPCPSPSPNPSALFRDISNFKTPKHVSQNSKFESPFPHFFTASKQTPSSSYSSAFRRRPSLAPSSRSKAARRLKAFEIEQSQSSRKAQIRKERSLRSLAKSLSVWLNFLFENPKSCGCDLSGSLGDDWCKESGSVLANGKRDSWPGVGVGTDRAWRSPKRPRDSSWRADRNVDMEPLVLSTSVFTSLQVSLRDVCSFEDLKERMGAYLSTGSCKEIFSVMAQVAKNIDNGRLKMKVHCPIVTDVGMKEKAIRILMCYNPNWLRIGLYIVFGADSLLPSGDVDSDEEVLFLKMVVEKQFFSHAGLAKAYAYNKLVDGLYRPGYFEALGNVILKRFLLLVLMLDRAKLQSSLPIKYGIDGIDGGSPLLFSSHCSVKSSQQMILDFLSSEVMHGEGNVLAHLVILGYKVSYQQCPLVEYEFRVTDIFEDLQDGVRLCRAIQLLQHDASILMKMSVPSDSRKKQLANCGIALQYLNLAGVPLSDEDGVMAVADDVANGDKELIISLLWNMFVHLQLPLLVNKMLLAEEILKVRGADMDDSKCKSSTPLEMLLEWIQAICQRYDFKIEGYASLVDGKAMWYLLDYYFFKELRCTHQKAKGTDGEEANLFAIDKAYVIHNFILLQKLATLLGSFPEVLQISDILEHNGACNERSVIILLAFFSSQLIGKKNMGRLNILKLLACNYQNPETKRKSLEKGIRNSKELANQYAANEYSSEDTAQKFKAIQAWWREMANRDDSQYKGDASSSKCCLTNRNGIDPQRGTAAKVIQSHFRGLIERRKFLKTKIATSFLQNVIRAWQTVNQATTFNKLCTSSIGLISYEDQGYSETFVRYLKFMGERHSFIRLKKSVVLIQQAVRTWINQKNQNICKLTRPRISISDMVKAAIVVQSCIRGWTARSKYGCMIAQLRKSESDFKTKAVVKIQRTWRRFTLCNSIHNQSIAATKIQSCFRAWLIRRNFLNLRTSILKPQMDIRYQRCQRDFQHDRITIRSAIIIQSCVRGWIARRVAYRERHLIILIQSRCRCWLLRRVFCFQRKAVIQIQSVLRSIKCQKAFQTYRHAATEIQRIARGQVARKRLLGASCFNPTIHSRFVVQTSRGCIQNFELKIILYSVLKLQKWWKRVLLLKSRTKSAIIIQSHVRGWIVRRVATREKQRIVTIQSYWKGYLARKGLRGKLLDLRQRVQRSAANVDNGMRLINRLVAALSELLSIKSVSSILHTCATLDLATEHSETCCETLVAAGAIETLLKLIRSVSRSIPDQEVLKHALSTLRNLARYPHLAEVLIDTHGSVEAIFWEMLRNKEEGYFISSELLKKLCSTQKGVEAVRKLPGLLKRLHSLVEDLKRKASNEKRNNRSISARDCTERKLKEAMELMKLTMTG